MTVDDVGSWLEGHFSPFAHQTRPAEYPGRFDSCHSCFGESGCFEAGIGTVAVRKFTNLLGRIAI